MFPTVNISGGTKRLGHELIPFEAGSLVAGKVRPIWGSLVGTHNSLSVLVTRWDDWSLFKSLQQIKI